jgi:TolA-binding protein
MKCLRPASDDDFERYLIGQMTDAEQQAFEEHYFGCDECFGRLEALRTIQSAARAVKSRKAPRWWPQGAVGIAAAVAIAAGLWLEYGRRPPPPVRPSASLPTQRSDQFAELARFEAPTWNPVIVRGASEARSKAVREAMKTYHAGDYRSAARQLRAVHPQTPEVEFYLGICDIESGDVAAGAAGLRRVIADGDTPWLEQAHFYLAKALLGSGDTAGASDQLKQVLAIHGDYAGEATKLLSALNGK